MKPRLLVWLVLLLGVASPSFLKASKQVNDQQQKEEQEKKKKARDEACKKKESGSLEALTDPSVAALCPDPTSLIQVAAGYTLMRYDQADALPVGWSIAVAARPTRFFALISELSGAYDSDAAVPGHTRTAIMFLDGPRVTVPVQRVTVFGEVLLGIAHDPDFRAGETDKNRFVWRPGGGVDVRLSKTVSARFQAGSILQVTDTDAPTVFQFSSGLVFGR